MKKNTSGIKKTLMIGAIGPDGWQGEFEATAEECTIVAQRLDIPKVVQLHAVVQVDFQDDLIRVSGHLLADLKRQCVVTLNICNEHLDTDFEALFSENVPVSGKEIEMKEAVETLDRGCLDFMNILTEQVGLLMNPFPKKQGVKGDYIEFSDEENKPFANLKNIIKKD
ncbi:MAG: hypothetical protein J6Y85_00925 [Alphaproteobacteria bacterium]|nr:hypothetical protein [Alphaproteobacteria bacterium]